MSICMFVGKDLAMLLGEVNPQEKSPIKGEPIFYNFFPFTAAIEVEVRLLIVLWNLF